MKCLRKFQNNGSLEDSGSSVRYVHERQESEQTGDNDGNDGKTVLCAVGQEPWSLAPQRQTVEHTGRSIKERVSSREGGCEDTSVDDVREDLDTGAGHDNNVGRLSSSTGVLEKSFIVVRHEHTSDEDTEDLRIIKKSQKISV